MDDMVNVKDYVDAQYNELYLNACASIIFNENRQAEAFEKALKWANRAIEIIKKNPNHAKEEEEVAEMLKSKINARYGKFIVEKQILESKKEHG